jgi:hypothetical protein
MFQVMVKEYPDMKYRTDYSSHSCRDTYISNCVEAGVNWKSILQWVGQSSYTIMNRYIKIQPKHMEDEMRKVF